MHVSDSSAQARASAQAHASLWGKTLDLVDSSARTLLRAHARATVRAILCTALIAPALVQAQSGAERWPERPVRVVVPFAPGGLVDGSMRAMAPKMTESLGQPVVIENKGGAGGVIGMAEVARSAADGYTILFGIESTVLAPYIYRNPGFDPLRDFAPVSLVLSVPIVYLVHPSVPAKTLQEFAAWTRANAGKVSAGSGGQGTSTHLALEMFKFQANADFVHIPYKGAGPAFTDFLAGQTQVFAVSTSFSAPHARAGKVVPLAVASATRAANMPDVPTVAEAGYAGLEYSTWIGIFAPAGTPHAVITRVRDAALHALRDPDNAKRFAGQGLNTPGSTPDEFRRFMLAESAKFAKAVAVSGLKPE